MVDLDDLAKLRETQSGSLPEHVRSWATYQKIPTGTRQSTVLSLYERYHMEEKRFVQYMLRSKTGLGDPERLVHEQIIKYGMKVEECESYFEYEVPCGTIGSVDFKVYQLECNPALVEVKNIASWKQSLVLLLYKKYHPECELVAAFFGARPVQGKQDIIRVALNELGIHCMWVNEHGELERFAGDGVADEF